MDKKSYIIDYVLLAVFALCIAGCLAAVLYFKTDPTLPVVLGIVAAAVLIAFIVRKNYRHSAYGGIFESRYPDGKA